MAKTAINVGSSANDGTGDPLRTAMQSTNSNINEIYSLFGDGSTLAISGDATVSAGALTIANDAVENAMIASGAIGSTEIAADAVTYAKLGAEFTTIQALSGTAVDWSAATVFTKTITATEALTFSNVETGMVISLVLTGGTAVTLPASVNVISGTYDPAVSNLIQITSTNGSTEQWAVISKPAA
tara:strand:- start:223 stop:777 length:555 start_codon:yes stop_codon:yes gene_type:complete